MRFHAPTENPDARRAVPCLRLQGLSRAVRCFAVREDGTITVFGMMVFVLMIGVGGIAVDVMRYETQRTQLQYTLDRAALAAASLSQTVDPEAVVQNYLDISGLEGYRVRTLVEEDPLGVSFRRVSIRGEIDSRPIFMRMFGVPVMTAPAAAAAEEQIPNIEIAMVLDISGSMGWQGRMGNLQPAARDFVTTMLEDTGDPDGEERVSISIVPYNGHVNMGSTVASVFQLTNEHTYSRCSRFYSADFDTPAIDPAVPIQRMGHFDRDSSNWNQTNTVSRPRCQTDEYGAILPWSQNEGALHALINSFDPNGTTAIDAGMKWAVGLLDPAAQPALSALVTAGDVHPDFDGRPLPYFADDSLKVIVLMTDGENTEQFDLVDSRRSGPSPFWRDPDDGDISVYYDIWDEYWHEDHDLWSDDPDGGSDDDAYRMDWSEVWDRIPAQVIDTYWFDDDAYNVAQPNGSSNWWRRDEVRDRENDYRMNDIVEQFVNGNGGDDRLERICDEAHANGIVVFSIAFEAPPDGRAVMEYCASSPSHFYDVDGLEISSAFSSIARTINRLRLVQ